jgi:hypothetical protein
MVELHDQAGRLVAHSLLLHEFIVKANSNRRPITALYPISPEPPATSQHSQLNSMDPALRKLSPANGPSSGGPTITIYGINFPPPSQQIIYVKFGDVAVPTV